MNYIFKGENILEFIKEFPTDDKCRELIAAQKWSMGYKCRDVVIPSMLLFKNITQENALNAAILRVQQPIHFFIK